MHVICKESYVGKEWFEEWHVNEEFHVEVSVVVCDGPVATCGLNRAD